MDGKREGEGEEAMEWELLHNNDDDEGVDELGPQLGPCALIRPDYFSLHPPPTPTAVVSSNSSSSSTDPNEVDRNFEDSYLADQLFPYLHQQAPQSSSSSSSSSSSAASSNNRPLSNDSDSDADSKAILLPQTTSASTAAAGGGALDSKEEDEEEHGRDSLEAVKEGEEEERRVVWWKVPLEVFKYWVVRVTPAAVPAWSLSVAAAAAFLGLLFLGRRLYKMKRRTQTLKLNLALDDKKVSQLMGRVARLNEAFSVVRRVPIVRPSLPAPNVTLRPVMSIR